jgi:hypothetical protein
MATGLVVLVKMEAHPVNKIEARNNPVTKAKFFILHINLKVK